MDSASFISVEIYRLKLQRAKALPTIWLIANCSYALKVGIDELILVFTKITFYPSLEIFDQFLKRET